MLYYRGFAAAYGSARAQAPRGVDSDFAGFLSEACRAASQARTLPDPPRVPVRASEGLRG